MRKLRQFFILPFLLIGIANAQNRTVHGTIVSDQDNKPVYGASIKVKNKSIGTTTGPDGSFSLNAPEGKMTLVVSYVGFVPVERIVDANTSEVTFALKENTNQLGEVVVTALGITRQSKTLVY